MELCVFLLDDPAWARIQGYLSARQLACRVYHHEEDLWICTVVCTGRDRTWIELLG